MSISYPDNTLNRAIVNASGLTDSTTYFDVVGAGSDKRLSLTELKKVGFQVINVRQYGAAVDGSTDDTAKIQAALTAAGDDYIVVIDGPCYVIDTITMPAGSRLIGISAAAKLIGPENWFNKPLIILNGDYCQLENITVEETNGSAQNVTKDSQASNVGVEVRGAWCTVRNVISSGFGFPFMCRDSAADGSRDNVIFEDCVGKNGIQWGFEIDSVHNAKYTRCTAHSNGLDGFKSQNEYSRTCDGMSFVQCHAYNNGLRDYIAGGFEDSNGNGWDLYTGGYRFKLIDCHSYENYGSGFNLKGGGGGSIPIQGEGIFIGCEASRNLSVQTSAVHGFEIGTNGDVGASILKFIGCICSDNDGDGIAVLGGYGMTFRDCIVTKNKQYGIRMSTSSDITVDGCSFFRNSYWGAVVGYTNNAAYTSKRIKFRNCEFSSSYDPFLAASSTMWSAAQEQKVFTADPSNNTFTSTSHGFSDSDVVRLWTYTGTMPSGVTAAGQYWVINSTPNTFELAATRYASGIDITSSGTGTRYATRDSELALRVYTDSADVTVEECSFSNHYSSLGHVYLTGKRCRVIRSRFYKGNTTALTVGNGTSQIQSCYFKDPDLTGSTTIGVVAVAGGSADVIDCEFERTGGASGTAVRFYNGSTLNRFEKITQTNFSTKILVSAGATFATDWVQTTAASGAPSSATEYWITGAIAYNSIPASGQPEYWRCVTAGAPGTWEDGPLHP